MYFLNMFLFHAFAQTQREFNIVIKTINPSFAPIHPNLYSLSSRLIIFAPL